MERQQGEKPHGALITHYDADGKPVSIDYKTREQLTRRRRNFLKKFLNRDEEE